MFMRISACILEGTKTRSHVIRSCLVQLDTAEIGRSIKETLRRRRTVTSSLLKYPRAQVGNRVVVRGRSITPPAPPPPLSTACFWTKI